MQRSCEGKEVGEGGENFGQLGHVAFDIRLRALILEAESRVVDETIIIWRIQHAWGLMLLLCSRR